MLAVCCLAQLAAAIVVPTAEGQTRIRVRSASSVDAQLTVAEHAGPARGVVQVEVRGTLRDDLGMGLPGAEVEITVAPDGGAAEARRALSDVSGHFRASLAVAPGPARLLVAFAGDGLHGPATHARRVDLGKVDVTLQLTGPRQVSVTASVVRLEVAAYSDEGSAALPLSLSLDGAGPPVARGETDRAGRWQAQLPVSRLGRPGGHELTASFPGDARRNAVTTSLRLVVRAPTFLTIHASPASLAPGDSATVEGLLADHAGPIARGAVGVFAGAHHLGTANVDPGGAYSLVIPIEETERGSLRLTARYVPDVVWREPATSPEVVVRVVPPRPVPIAWIGAIAGVTLLLLAAAQLARRPGRDAPAAVGGKRAKPPPMPGVSLARAPRARPAITSVAGRVADVDDATAPVAAALVRVVRGDEELVVATTDADGRFALEELPAGRLTLHFTADGYAPQQATASIPHRGEWSSVEVRLESMRRRVERLFRDAVVPGYVTAERYATSTAREVARSATSRRGAPPEVETLARLAEHASYAPEPPGDDDIARARGVADRVASPEVRRSR